MPRNSLLTALVLTLFPLAANAQTALAGRVVDSREQLPVAGAQVRLLTPTGELVATTLAGEDGQFRFEGPSAGLYGLEVSRVGYALLTAEAIPMVEGEETFVEVRMGVDAVEIDGVVVVARELYRPTWLREFDARVATNERLGRGRIFTRVDIDRMKPIRATDLLATTLWRGGCQPEILLDGLPADQSLSMVRGDELEGVEIYRGFAQIPQEYYQTGMCGLVMFWRRPDAPGLAPLTWRRVGLAGAILLVAGATAVVF